MSGFGIDGLASGLNTTAILNQLMAIERQPLVRLQQRQSTWKTRIDAWGQIDAKLSALNTALQDLRQKADFNVFKAASTNDKIFTATASSSASAGTFSFKVEKLAVSHQQISNGFAASTDLVGTGRATVSQGLASVGITSVNASTGGLATGGYDLEVTAVDTGAGTATVVFNGQQQTVSIGPGTFTLTSSGGSIDVTVGSQFKVGTADIAVIVTDATTTVADFQSKVNTAQAGSSASLVNTGSGATPYKLIVTSSETGTDNALTIDVSGLSGFTSMTDLRAADNAKITFGGGTQQIISQSNTVKDVLAGVTINLVSADAATEVTLTVSQDQDALVAKVKKFVDNLNAVVSTVKNHTKYDVDKKKGGTLLGDLRAREVVADITEALGYQDSSLTYSYLASVGVSVDRNGTWSLDETKLKSALAANSDHVVKLFADDAVAGKKGVMGTLHDSLDAMITAGGLVDTAEDGAKTQTDTLQEQIDAYEVRLVSVEARYRRQFTALETALSQMRNQGAWLAAQVGSLR